MIGESGETPEDIYIERESLLLSCWNLTFSPLGYMLECMYIVRIKTGREDKEGYTPFFLTQIYISTAGLLTQSEGL